MPVGARDRDRPHLAVTARPSPRARSGPSGRPRCAPDPRISDPRRQVRSPEPSAARPGRRAAERAHALELARLRPPVPLRGAAPRRRRRCRRRGRDQRGEQRRLRAVEGDVPRGPRSTTRVVPSASGTARSQARDVTSERVWAWPAGCSRSVTSARRPAPNSATSCGQHRSRQRARRLPRAGGCPRGQGVEGRAWCRRPVPRSPRHEARPSPAASNASVTGFASIVRGETGTGAAPAAAGRRTGPRAMR